MTPAVRSAFARNRVGSLSDNLPASMSTVIPFATEFVNVREPASSKVPVPIVDALTAIVVLGPSLALPRSCRAPQANRVNTSRHEEACEKLIVPPCDLSSEAE